MGAPATSIVTAMIYRFHIIEFKQHLHIQMRPYLHTKVEYVPKYQSIYVPTGTTTM